MLPLTLRGRRRGSALALGVALLLAGLAVPRDDVAASASTRAAADECGALRLKADGRAWRCTFVDEFEGTRLDSRKWFTRDTWETGFRSGQTCFRTGPENLQVASGAVRLTVRRERHRFDCRKGLRHFFTKYTGAMIGTRGRFSQTYGRFEVRAKYPAVEGWGVHGGFWMFPREQTYGAWPASGEIDVAEWWSHDPTLVLPSLHFRGRDPDVDSGWGCRVETPERFHTYRVEWEPSGFRFYIDGVLCFRRRTPDPIGRLAPPQPFDHPFSLILNMGVAAQGVSGKTPVPATYVVDHVKAWR